MKLKDCRENYYFNSGKTSDIVRQLGFAGIAIIWLFKTEVAGLQIVPADLRIAVILIVLALLLDLLQYVSGTMIWGIYNRMKEKDGTTETEEFRAPSKINWLTIFFFWAKTAFMAIAYLQLFKFLAARFL